MADDVREVLPEGVSLQAFLRGALIFESRGKWLHPLFDLEPVLPPAAAGEVQLLDRRTGRAAAFLVARMGIKTLHTETLSRRAVPILDRFGITCTARVTVERLGCATEDLLMGIQGLDEAFAVLTERRARALVVRLQGPS